MPHARASAHGLPEHAVQMVPTQDREAVGIMLRDMARYIDVIVPRGGKSLVARVQQDARVPVMSHLEGICHTYIHEGADLAMAPGIAVNAKMRRTGICGATETILVDRAVRARPIVDNPVVVAQGATLITVVRPRRAAAGWREDSDWGKEFLDAIVAVRVIDGLDEALAHIRRYGSAHTDAIITSDPAAAERFLERARWREMFVMTTRRRNSPKPAASSAASAGRGDRHRDRGLPGSAGFHNSGCPSIVFWWVAWAPDNSSSSSVEHFKDAWRRRRRVRRRGGAT